MNIFDKGLVHRDLKPSNIFFAMDGTVKVGDLGLVKDMMTDQQTQNRIWNNEGMQTVDFIQKKHTDQIGTRSYMSPEQIASKPYNHKVDVYALAVILFELLVPFKTGSERVNVIADLKLLRFPPDFQELYSPFVVTRVQSKLIIDLMI